MFRPYESELKGYRNIPKYEADLLFFVTSITQYAKGGDFIFRTNNIPFMDSNIPSSPVYDVFISHLIRYTRAS